MRLQRNTAKIWRNYAFVALVGACGWGAAWCSATDPNSVFTNTRIFAYGSAAMFILAACALVSLCWPLVIHVDDTGMTVRANGATTWLPWSSVEMVTAVKRGADWSDPMLEIRVTPGVRVKGRLGRVREGWRVYQLLPLESFTCPPEQTVAILHRYSGGKVDAKGYLTYRAGKQAVARWSDEVQRTTDRPDDSDGRIQ
ncbi:hypothetical protein [Salinispora arenicola]|uniref:hypothetical protein n=1 Tax=Salinispora arenicola TaxID=168697 RepID=UPI0016B6B6AC|nr:hypothetical protein [Salinispora arenicola]NIL59437.1 hypothetical protein [Salinispora arenicola]NIL63519.1 hypothetical protein [Salinispora arenicola]